MDMIKLKALRWEVIPDYPGGLNAIIRVLRRRDRGSERPEGAMVVGRDAAVRDRAWSGAMSCRQGTEEGPARSRTGRGGSQWPNLKPGTQEGTATIRMAPAPAKSSLSPPKTPCYQLPVAHAGDCGQPSCRR